MMQAADLGNRDDRAQSRRLNWPPVGCVLVEREMSASPVIVREVAGQDAAQVAFAEDKNVIETLAPDRADEPFHERILPGALRRRNDFLDLHSLHSVPKLVAVDVVTIANELGRPAVARESVHGPLGGPVGSGLLGHAEVRKPARSRS